MRKCLSIFVFPLRTTLATTEINFNWKVSEMMTNSIIINKQQFLIKCIQTINDKMMKKYRIQFSYDFLKASEAQNLPSKQQKGFLDPRPAPHCMSLSSESSRQVNMTAALLKCCWSHIWEYEPCWDVLVQVESVLSNNNKILTWHWSTGSEVALFHLQSIRKYH